MTLTHLLPLLDAPDAAIARGERHIRTADLPSAARPAVIAAMAARLGVPILVVTARQETADMLGTALALFLPPASPPVPWSAPDPLPYEQLPHDAALSARRSAILGALVEQPGVSPLVIVATVRALMATVRRPASYRNDVIRVEVGQRRSDAALVRDLVAAGYRVEPLVDGPCTVSRRGGIIDVYTPGPDEGVRIEFFGDEIDSIRRFDPVTQRSIERVRAATLLPPLEFDLTARDDAVARLT
ncbi:MAG: transcription-repair coupling factor, partial [Chloroflexi bacterium]